MASYNAIWPVGFQQLLTRRLGMTGTAAPAPMLAPEVMPAIVLESDRPEWKFLAGERWNGVGLNEAADAGATSTCRIANPSQSNTLAVIDRIQVGSSAAASVLVKIHRTLTALANVAIPFPTDGRLVTDANILAGAAVAVVQVSSDGAASLGIAIYRTRFAAGTSAVMELPIILSPGTAIDITTGAVNQNLDVSVVWRERVAAPGELV